MDQDQQQLENALQAAQMYYYQNLPMKRIAAELEVSHSTISRLLTWARNEGLIEIRINDVRRRASPLEEVLKLHFKLKAVKVVAVAEVAGESVWQDRVARVAANYLSQFMEPDMILGVAVGQMVNHIAACLTPKSLINSHVVQLNGGSYVPGPGREHSSNLIAHIASNYEAMGHLFSVPSFFDYPETKQVLWRESSIQRILNLQNKSDLILFSPENLTSDINRFHADSAEATDQSTSIRQQLESCQAVGLVANVLIDRDGQFENIPLNQQACGPDLSLFNNVDRAICVVSGSDKLDCLWGALRGKYVTDLIIDEPTARRLVESFSSH